jgi:hypothetical protein
MYRALQGRCGMFCGECEIYMAYSTNDTKSLQKMAREQSKVCGKTLEADDIKCLGCKGTASACWGASCAIRRCAESRGIEFCYQCRDFPCRELESLFEKKPVVRDNLKMISKIGPDAWVSTMMSKSPDAGRA